MKTMQALFKAAPEQGLVLQEVHYPPKWGLSGVRSGPGVVLD